jgi:hypothetical protein
MNCINRKNVKKLVEDPLSMMMDDEQLEHVIVTFVSVLNKPKTDRGG